MNEIKNLPEEKPLVEKISPEAKTEDIFRALNEELLLLLKNKNFQKFAEYIHPDKGIAFSMYAYLNPERNKHFTKAEFLQYSSTSTKFTWGTKDGTGDLLQLPIQNYIEQWVFKKDFSKSEYAFDSVLKSGNSLNNLKEVYPQNHFTDNYIPGSEQYAEMDWKILRFVYEEIEGKIYLVAVINDEWTT
ncbi:hypothetical protein [Chryseobacterium sp. MP_3.2]|uniref:hypothetical protein n=1 Tax=Chryseobacterium sp. MP_3.2 TaxID=3071712 RepID=UPI002E0DC7C4